MKLLIAIPSRSRPDQAAKVLSLFAAHRVDIKVFIEPKQRKDYSLYIDSRLLHVLQANDQGLAYCCSEIALFAKQHSYDIVFKCDDDVTRFCCRTQHQDEVLRDLLRHVTEAFFSMPSLGGVSLPYSHQMFSLYRWVGIGQRFQTCYFIRPQFLDCPFPLNINIWEDFLRGILIKRSGMFALRYGMAGIQCAPVGINPGGFQDLNRGAEAAHARTILDSLVPDLVWKDVAGKQWPYEPDFARTPSLRGKGIRSDSLHDREVLALCR